MVSPGWTWACASGRSTRHLHRRASGHNNRGSTVHRKHTNNRRPSDGHAIEPEVQREAETEADPDTRISSHVVQRCMERLTHGPERSPTGGHTSADEHTATYFLMLASHAHGNRVLQRCLEDANPLELEQLSSLITRCAPQLACHEHGNFVLQRMLDLCDRRAVGEVCARFRGQLRQLSTNKFGSFTVRHCLVASDRRTYRWMTDELLHEDTTAVLSADQHGSHVVRCMLGHSDRSTVAAVCSRLVGKLYALSTTRFGTYTVQKCITSCEGETRGRLLAELMRGGTLSVLSVDRYGRHVVRCVLEHSDRRTVGEVCALLRGQLRQLSAEKFGSLTVRKCLEVCDERVRRWIIEELLTDDTVAMLAADPYGNHVVRCVLEYSDQETAAAVCAHLGGQLRQLSADKYGSLTVRKCLEVCEEGARRWMVDELATGDTLAMLAAHQYGNYVVLCVLDRSDQHTVDMACLRLRGKLQELSSNEFGSFVIRKCLQVGANATYTWMMGELGSAAPASARRSPPASRW
jgi:Pumilio-family RNA binding repeat